MSGTINIVLNQMYQNYAQLFAPADMMQIQRTSIAMVKNGFVQLPNDYVQFLRISDGLNWNGLELFSITPHERHDTVFPQLTLLEYQQANSIKSQWPKSIIIGMAMEEWILYRADKREYDIIDRYSLESVIQLPRLSDVLYFYWQSGASNERPVSAKP